MLFPAISCYPDQFNKVDPKHWYSMYMYLKNMSKQSVSRMGPRTRARPTTLFFCGQVFFENDPSSATSLLSHDKWLEWRLAQGNEKAEPFQISNHARQGKKILSTGPIWSSPVNGESSATRSSLKMVLLLLPVFFLRHNIWPRTLKEREYTPNRICNCYLYASGATR